MRKEKRDGSLRGTPNGGTQRKSPREKRRKAQGPGNKPESVSQAILVVHMNSKRRALEDHRKANIIIIAVRQKPPKPPELHYTTACSRCTVYASAICAMQTISLISDYCPLLYILLPQLHQRDGSDRSGRAPEQYMPPDRRQ